MRQRRFGYRLVALAAVVTLLAAACAEDGADEGHSGVCRRLGRPVRGADGSLGGVGGEQRGIGR